MKQIRLTQIDIIEADNINTLFAAKGIRLRRGLEARTIEYGEAPLESLVDPPFSIYHNLANYSLIIEQGERHALPPQAD